ncbi:MAG: hypothetical protein EOO07_34310 [Chitinophagaceae bacterium]|nr:MAG: hypothetical protein EOO07_34310 [Chitinophagaceae bacterium]
MIYKILILALSFSSCLESDAQQKKAIKKPIVKAKQVVSNFTGDYEGNNSGKVVTINMKSTGNNISGTLLMNGETAKLSGISKNNIATGKITEDVSGKTYVFDAERKLNDLYISITFPEYNNQVLKLNLQKVVLANNNKTRDQKLIGTWRNTEVISSGSGQFYSSFSTDYFARFNADGTALIWTGKSAGGTKDVTIDGSGGKNLQKMEWYTSGKNLYLVNPQNRQQSAVSFYAEPNRMMLSSAKSKKVYQRVN